MPRILAVTPVVIAGGKLILQADSWLVGCPSFAWGSEATNDAIQAFIIPPGERTRYRGASAFMSPGAKMVVVDPGPSHESITFAAGKDSTTIKISPATNSEGVSISTVAEVVDAINLFNDIEAEHNWQEIGFDEGEGLVAKLVGTSTGAPIFEATSRDLAVIVQGRGNTPVVYVGTGSGTTDWLVDVVDGEGVLGIPSSLSVDYEGTVLSSDYCPVVTVVIAGTSCVVTLPAPEPLG